MQHGPRDPLSSELTAGNGVYPKDRRARLYEGYVRSVQDISDGTRTVILTAAVSHRRIAEVLCELAALSRRDPGVIIQNGTDIEPGPRLYRESIDLPVLQSTLMDFTDMLEHHGGMTLWITRADDSNLCIHLTRHKIIRVLGQHEGAAQRILNKLNVHGLPRLNMLDNIAHIHVLREEMDLRFGQLQTALYATPTPQKNNEEESGSC